MKIDNTMFEEENQGVHPSFEQFTESTLEQREKLRAKEKKKDEQCTLQALQKEKSPINAGKTTNVVTLRLTSK